MTGIYIDADACPVREEVYRVAGRLGLVVHVVSNGSRPIRPPGLPRCGWWWWARGRTLPTTGSPSGSGRAMLRDLGHSAGLALSRARRAGTGLNGKVWTADNIGGALAGREVARHMREMGLATGGPSALTKADRSRFLSALDTLVRAAQAGS